MIETPFEPGGVAGATPDASLSAVATQSTMRFLTLGPNGSCHENAVGAYFDHHGLPEAEIELVDAFLPALDRVFAREADYLVACSAHPTIHLVTERFHREVQIVDVFVYPTKDIVVLERAEVAEPVTLGSVHACDGYVIGLDYAETIYETTKPVVGAGLLEGKYDAGVTTMDVYDAAPERFRIRRHVGPVLTSWLVFGRGSSLHPGIYGVLPAGAFPGVSSVREEES